MSKIIQIQDIVSAVQRVSNALRNKSDYINLLDQSIGDGDTGITLNKITDALLNHNKNNPIIDIGKFLMSAGMATNKAAPSTLGTLIATALMRAGKTVKGKADITNEELALMFKTATAEIQQRGKAQLGDKTIVDAIYPASEAFGKAIAENNTLSEAGNKAIVAAEAGLESVTPLRSKIGRASWVGERTKGKIDPGCAALVTILRALVE